MASAARRALRSLFRRFAGAEGGSTAVEYGVLLAMIAMIIAAIALVGGSVKEKFDAFQAYF